MVGKPLKSETQKVRELAWRHHEAGDSAPVVIACDELLKRDPTDVDAMFMLGTAYYHSGQHGLATLFLNAARCATKDTEKLGAIWCNIGCALQEYQPEEAYAVFRRSLQFGTPPPAVYDNLCATASKAGRHAEALEWADKSLAVDTSHNKSFALMHLGRWAEAWKLYAKSAGTPVRPRTERDFGLPRWDGKSAGKVIIHGEQGVGDEIMFLSMLPRDFDGVIETSPRIEGLVQRSFPSAAVYGTLLQSHLEWPLEERADWHLEMGGIGEFFAPEPFSGPAWLSSDPDRCEGWAAYLRSASRSDGGGSALSSDVNGGLNRPHLQDISNGHAVHFNDRQRGQVTSHRMAEGRPSRPVVGLAWTGGTWATGRQHRTIPFELIAELIRAHPNVTFVNLEYEDRRDELSSIEDKVLDPHWATKKGADLDDLAALVSGLDLVISVTTSLVDLAGALGIPCWCMVDENPQWRYSEAAGPDAMWFYSSVRCFRQKPNDNKKWGRVMDLVGKALEQWESKSGLQVSEQVAAQ